MRGGADGEHLAQAGEVSLFFWGQRYGLTIFESGTAAAAFRLFGLSNDALKGAMLFLWSVGWCFYVLAAHRWAGRRGAVLTAICLIVSPGWASFSMKARGGYVTAFVLTGLILWVVARESTAPTTGTPASPAADAPIPSPRRSPCAAGAGAAALAAAGASHHRPDPQGDRLRRDVVPLGFGFVVLLIAGTVVPSPHRLSYWTPAFMYGFAPWRALVDLPKNLWVVAGGASWMDYIPPMGLLTKVAGALWVAAWVASGIWGAGSATGPLGRGADARGLPVGGGDARPPHRAVPVPVFRAVARRRSRSPSAPRSPPRSPATAASACSPAGGLAILLATSIFALRELGRVSTSGIIVPAGSTAPEAVTALLARLRAEGIRHVYGTDPLVQWSIIWESRERIIARWFHPKIAFPNIPRPWTGALLSGERVAVVWTAEQVPLLADKVAAIESLRAPVVVAGTFYLAIDPGIEAVRRLGFRLNEPAQR